MHSNLIEALESEIQTCRHEVDVKKAEALQFKKEGATQKALAALKQMKMAEERLKGHEQAL